VENWRTEGDAEFMEGASGVSSANTTDGSGAGRPRGPTRRRVRPRGEQRSSGELLLRLTGCGSIVRESDVSVPNLEGQANITGAGVAASATTNSPHISNL
jgi:hypothetical protein